MGCAKNLFLLKKVKERNITSCACGLCTHELVEKQELM